MAELVSLDIPPELDKPVTLKIDATGAGDLGTLITYASSENVENAEVTVQEDARIFTLTFNPPSPDKYSLTVKWGDDPISGSPFELNLNTPNSKQVSIAEPPQSNLRAGQSIGICFDASNAGRGELTATCEGEKVGEVPVEVNQRGISLKYDFKFVPPHEDVYRISIMFSGKLIKGSPFKLDLVPVNASKVKASKINMPQGLGGPIEMDIGTEDAGNAPLKATCMGSVAGKVPVTVSKLSKHNYKLSVHPPNADIFTLSVQYGSKHIPNSPFFVNTMPTDASKVEVKEPKNPEVLQQVCYQVNTLHAGAGSLSASCYGNRSGEVDVEISEVGTAKHHVSFTPPRSDEYTVKIEWSGVEVPGSPFELSLILPPEGYKVKAGEMYVPENVGTDQYVWIELDCSDAGFGEVKGEAKGTESQENVITVQVDTLDPDKYRVKFKPKQPDVYTLTITYGGMPIPGSPFRNINLRGGPMPQYVKHLGTDYPAERGEPIFLTFDTQKAGNGTFRARVAGLSTGPTTSTFDLEPDSKYTYQVSFLPQAADTYLVDVYWSDTPVPNSPFYVEIIYADKVTADKPKVVSMYYPIRFNVNTTDAGPGVLKATCCGAACGEVEVEVKRDHYETEKYSVHFQPSHEDLYTLSIFFGRVEIQQSPFTIDLRPIVPTKLDKFIGEPLKVILDKGSLGGLVANASGQQTGDADIDINRNDEGYIEVLFNPRLPDRYSVEIKMDDEHVSGSPYILNYTVPIDASKCVLLGLEQLPSVLLVDQEISFRVDASKAGNGALSVNVNSPSSDLDPLTVSIMESEAEPRVYRISYTPTSPGLHKVSVEWSGQPIPLSPISHSIMIPRPPEEIPIHPLNKPLMFHFTTKCEPQDICAYAVHDDTCTRYTLKIGKGNDGKLKLILRAQLAGIHIIHFLKAGKEIHRSPLKVKFIEADPNACRVIDIPQEAYAGEETSFKVDTANAGKGDLHILATVPAGGKSMSTTHKDHQNGFYSVLFTPKVAGTYHFKITWAGEEIPESPIIMNILQPDSARIAARQAASRVHILKEDRYVFAAVLPITKPAYFCVATGRAGSGKLALKARGPGEAQVRVVDRKNGTYTCEVKPSVSGKYLISIFWNEIEIPGSPYQLDFTGMKSYMICGLDLENEKFHLGIPFEFPVNCGKQDGSKLTVSSNPPDIATFELNPQTDTTDNVYMCKITPKVVGNHEISVMYDGHHIVNSPYYVQFDEKEQTGDNLEELSVARPLTPLGLYLDMANEQVVMADDQSETLMVAPLSKNVRAYGPGLSDGFIGQEGNFTIETAEAGCGILEVSVTGLKGTFQVKMRRHPDRVRLILVRYDPIYIGEYTINVLWSGCHILGSPYTVHFAEQEKAPQSNEEEERADIELHNITEEEESTKRDEGLTDGKKDGNDSFEEKPDLGREEETAKRAEIDVNHRDGLDEQFIKQEVIEA